jgi:hypothetical protein
VLKASGSASRFETEATAGKHPRLLVGERGSGAGRRFGRCARDDSQERLSWLWSRLRSLLRGHHGRTGGRNQEGIKPWAVEDILRLVMNGIVLTKQQTLAVGTTGTVVVFVAAGKKTGREE